MPLRPPAETDAAPCALSDAAGRGVLYATVEARLAEVTGVWSMRLLVRDLIARLGRPIEEALRAGGVPARLRRVEAVRITRGVRAHGSCTIARAQDGVCRLAFSGHLFFAGNAAALVGIVAHELLHACLPAREGHGALFHTGMALLEGALGLRVAVYSDASAIRQSESLYRYKAVCAACGQTSYYLRAGALVRHPARYRCARCGQSAFQIFRLPREA